MYAHRQAFRNFGADNLLAGAFGHMVDETVAAAGSTQTDATQLSQGNGAVIIASGTGGVRLPSAATSTHYVIRNNSGNTITVYPAVGEALNGTSVNTGFTTTSATSRVLVSALIAGTYRWAST
jgi:S-adenosylmethionine:tRNA-ribosyltransferase-isomerase (queuine synthetase)